MVLQRWEEMEPFYSLTKRDIVQCGSFDTAGNEQVSGLLKLERQAKCWHPKDAFAGCIEKRIYPCINSVLSNCIPVPFLQTLTSRDLIQTYDLRLAQMRKHPRFPAVRDTSSILGALASPKSGLYRPSLRLLHAWTKSNSSPGIRWGGQLKIFNSACSRDWHDRFPSTQAQNWDGYNQRNHLVHTIQIPVTAPLAIS
ncbi:hypothetical protein KL938_003263 [Ogataea parapolymorpha]|nr:hypothetical protein KL938_003263 [Ogataea parapolymorpha]